tara:strand:- start:217 stop:531 length:315 start_codon:yes stop_codon:yes gene_type:complete
MAKGDITKELEYDKIEIVNKYNVQVRQALKIMEEQTDGSKIELSRSFQRHVLLPYKSIKNSEHKWVHTDTDLSKEDPAVKAIAEATWTDDVKTAYKKNIESQTP